MGRGYLHLGKFSPNDSKTVCDRTGFETTVSQTQETWEGWRVIPEAWEARQPQDFPVVPQKQAVFKDSRYEQAIAATGCTTGAVAGIAIAGCAVAGVSSGSASGSFNIV